MKTNTILILSILWGLFAMSVYGGGGFVGASIGDHNILTLDIEKDFNYKSPVDNLTATFEVLSLGLTYQKFPQDKTLGVTFGKTVGGNLYRHWGVYLNSYAGLVYMIDFERIAFMTGFRSAIYYDFVEVYVQYRQNMFCYKTYQRSLNGVFLGVGLRL